MREVHGSGPNGISEPKSIRKSDFAKLAKVSPGRVSQMIRDGLPVEPDGRIDVARGTLWVKENIDARRSAAQSKQAELPLAAQPTVAEERARLVREQADHAALKNAALRRELIPAKDVEREWVSILRRVRSGLLAIPERIRSQHPELSGAAVATLDAEIRAVLESLAHD